jgi:protein tyrosine phosphatase (PTP) superfamily phosphohydrolase (DUF442 family)
MIFKHFIIHFISVGMLLSAGSAFADPHPTNTSGISKLEIINLTPQANQLFTGGQPTKEQLKSLSAMGIKHIINLRPLAEQTFNEAEHVTNLEMGYHSIPVADAQAVSFENARALSQLLIKFNGEGVFVHCASGNRVGALMALSASEQGLSEQAAIEKGQRFGMTSLEPVVRKVLNGSVH